MDRVGLDRLTRVGYVWHIMSAAHPEELFGEGYALKNLLVLLPFALVFLRLRFHVMVCLRIRSPLVAR